MAALLEFMYKGEVHVSQKALESFLKAAESLQVGLKRYTFNLQRDSNIDFIIG